MIKIIKPGKTDFRMTCNKCGCIFEYNIEDINDGYIKCPTCHKDYYGFEPEYLEKTPLDTGLAECEPAGYLGKAGRLQTLPNESTYQSLNECEGCPTYKQLCSPNGYVGDLPCQWCNKNPWKVTCNTATYTTSVSNETRGARSWTTYSSTAELPAKPNYYTINSGVADGTYSYSEINTDIPDTYGTCCSYSCGKTSRESERSCEAEAEPTPGKCACFSKLNKKATKKRKAAK